MNKNIMNFKLLLTLLGFNIFFSNYSYTQCTPSPSSDCLNTVKLLCGLGELNGYTCQITADQHPDYYPCGTTALCPGSGPDDGPQNTEWWSFVTKGGNVSITINYSSCNLGQGLQMGIWADCFCGQEITCHSICTGAPGSYTILANLEACKYYYLFVDGCGGDICNYTLSITGGDAPELVPVTSIIGETKFCEGNCNMYEEVERGSSSCLNFFKWTLDGLILEDFERVVRLPQDLSPGTYTLCVSKFVGDNPFGQICSETAPFCKTITIEPKKSYVGNKAYICFNKLPYYWHGIEINSDGTYTKEFADANCCKYDSVRDFYILPIPESPSVYFIGSDSTDLYKDPTTGQQYKGCNNYKIIDVINSTIPYRCDSAYHLFTIYPGFKSVMESACREDSLLYFPNIKDVTKYCANNVDVKYTFAYRWFETSDTSVTISHEENLNATLLKKGNYCLELSVDVGYGDADKKIKTFFCEYFNEDSIQLKDFKLKGDTIICDARTSIFSIDSTLYYQSIHWNVTGGLISTPDPENKTQIQIEWDSLRSEAEVCVGVRNFCDIKKQICQKVYFLTSPSKPDAGADLIICGSNSTLKANSNGVGGIWRQICGDSATIASPQLTVSNVEVNQAGKYCFEWVSGNSNCSSSDTVELTFYDTFTKDTIEQIICDTSLQGYTYQFSIIGGKTPYLIIKGNGTIENSTVYHSAYVPNQIPDTVILRDDNGCEFQFIQNHTCETTNNKVVDQLQDIKILPNPASECIYITGMQNIQVYSIELYDLSGRRAMYLNDKDITDRISIKHLRDAVYYVKINTAKGVKLNSFIKSSQ